MLLARRVREIVSLGDILGEGEGCWSGERCCQSLVGMEGGGGREGEEG